MQGLFYHVNIYFGNSVQILYCNYVTTTIQYDPFIMNHKILKVRKFHYPTLYIHHLDVIKYSSNNG